MGLRSSLCLALLLALLAWPSCAKDGPPAPEIPPDSPAAEPVENAFKRMAEAIEPGITRQREIREAFGDPDDFEKRWDGSATWRYEHAVLIGEASIAPDVAAREASRKRAVLEATSSTQRSFRRWWHRTFHFPPARPEPLVEKVPATLHNLSVDFKPDGVVEDFVYGNELGFVTVPK